MLGSLKCEADVFQSMKITESYHEIEAELTLKLKELKINGTDESSGVTVNMHSPKNAIPSTYLRGNKYSPVNIN